MESHLKRVSKFLSLVLRHKPELIDLKLDKQGWASIEQVIRGATRIGVALDEPLLRFVVEQNDKQRFMLSEDGRFIRAHQGHSIPVDLQWEAKEPPEFLFHGTVSRFLDSILQNGLIKGKRHHVHLSGDTSTAHNVGSRRGTPVLLRIASGEMHRNGFLFFLSENGVWLTEHVPPEWIEVLEEPRPFHQRDHSRREAI